MGISELVYLHEGTMVTSETRGQSGADTVERKAPNHMPVLLQSFRDETMFETGLITRKGALSTGTYDSFSMLGMGGACRSEKIGRAHV